jgi:hypothetical protein
VPPIRVVHDCMVFLQAAIGASTAPAAACLRLADERKVIFCFLRLCLENSLTFSLVQPLARPSLDPVLLSPLASQSVRRRERVSG